MTNDRKPTSIYDLWQAWIKPDMLLPGPRPDDEMIVGDSDPQIPQSQMTLHTHFPD